MKQQRVLRLFCAGGALAACIALAVVFGISGHQRVEAAMIFDSLRDAVRRSLWIEFTNLEEEGVRADGRLLIVFDDVEGEADAERNVAATYGDVRIVAAADQADFPGLDLEIAGGSRPEDRWAFVHAANLPNELFSEMPMLWLFQGALTRGTLIDLSNLPEDSAAITSQLWMEQPNPSDDETVTTISFGIGGDAVATDGELRNLIADAVASGSGDADYDSDASKFTFNFKSGGKVIVTESAPAGDGPIDDEQMREYVGIAQSVLNGSMTTEQFESLVDALQASAQNVTVTPLGDGRHRLNASAFNFDGAADDPDVTLEITYHETAGVEWMEILNLGEGDGRVRLEFTDADANDPLFDRARYAARDGVQTLDLGAIASMFGGGASQN